MTFPNMPICALIEPYLGDKKYNEAAVAFSTNHDNMPGRKQPNLQQT